MLPTLGPFHPAQYVKSMFPASEHQADGVVPLVEEPSSSGSRQEGEEFQFFPYSFFGVFYVCHYDFHDVDLQFEDVAVDVLEEDFVA